MPYEPGIYTALMSSKGCASPNRSYVPVKTWHLHRWSLQILSSGSVPRAATVSAAFPCQNRGFRRHQDLPLPIGDAFFCSIFSELKTLEANAVASRQQSVRRFARLAVGTVAQFVRHLFVIAVSNKIGIPLAVPRGIAALRMSHRMACAMNQEDSIMFKRMLGALTVIVFLLAAMALAGCNSSKGNHSANNASSSQSQSAGTTNKQTNSGSQQSSTGSASKQQSPSATAQAPQGQTQNGSSSQQSSTTKTQSGSSKSSSSSQNT